jgi:hypothetical protein
MNDGKILSTKSALFATNISILFIDFFFKCLLCLYLFQAISDLTALEFDDNLKVYSLSDNEIGDFSVRVKQVVYKNQDCFQINAKRFLFLPTCFRVYNTSF